MSISFNVEITDSDININSLELPSFKVELNRTGKDDSIDFKLGIEFLYDGENESDIVNKCDEIRNQQFGCCFTKDPLNDYQLNATIGNDVKVAAAIILYYILLFAKNHKFALKSNYSFSLHPNGDLSLLLRQPNINPFTSVKNVLSNISKF